MKRHNILALVVAGGITTFGVGMLAICLAPVFTSCIVALMSTVVLFLMSEQWYTHDAAEFENRFWTLIAFIFIFLCIFCHDSPLRFAPENVSIGWAIIIIFTYLAHLYDRMLRSYVLGHIPIIKRNTSAQFGIESRASAKKKQKELEKLIDCIDQRWMSSAIQNLFLLPRVLYIEHQIVNVFTEASDDELNMILTAIGVGRFLYKIKDHKIARHYNRTKLLKLLCVERVRGLTVPAKAMLLDGMQRMKLSAHSQCDVFVKSIVKSTQQDDLSELKSITDAKGDIYSMHKLIYSDIRSKNIQNEILDYIKAQANIQIAHLTMKGRHIAGRRKKFAWRKILSDVDDTLLCSGGVFPAGSDKSYPRKALYPGVLAFYRELDLGTNSDFAEWQPQMVGNLVFLSARPHVYKDVAESVIFEKVRSLQERYNLYTSPTLLAGCLNTGGKFMVSGDFEHLAIKKFENFREYLKIYPEYSCIFVGDNGQGDVRTAEMVLDSDDYKRNLQRIYIHKVIPVKESFVLKSEFKSHHPKLCHFTTYIDAGIDAFKNGLLKSAGLQRIISESLKDFKIIKQEDWIAIPPERAAIVAKNDPKSIAKRASITIAADSQININQLAARRGSTTHTAIAGKTELAAFSSTLQDTVIQGTVILETSSSTPPTPTPAKVPSKEKKVYIAPEELLLMGSEHILKNCLRFDYDDKDDKRQHRLREIDSSMYQANAILMKEGLAPVALDIKYTNKFSPKTIIHTVYGYGLITSYREDNGMYEVNLALSIDKTFKAYLLSNSITAYFQPIVKQPEVLKITVAPL